MWSQMASKLADHHILSIELIRTMSNETLAVFTVVKDGRPVQYVLKGDAMGANQKALVTHQLGPIGPIKLGALHQMEAVALPPAPPPPPPGLTDNGASAESIAMGEPPPKQPPPPGIASLGASLLPTAFNLGETAASADSTKR
jgi:hypothetical protein